VRETIEDFLVFAAGLEAASSDLTPEMVERALGYEPVRGKVKQVPPL